MFRIWTKDFGEKVSFVSDWMSRAACKDSQSFCRYNGW